MLCNFLSLDQVSHLPTAQTNGTFESVMWLEESGRKRGWREELFKHDRSFLTWFFSWQVKTHLPSYLQDAKSPNLNLPEKFAWCELLGDSGLQWEEWEGLW